MAAKRNLVIFVAIQIAVGCADPGSDGGENVAVSEQELLARIDTIAAPYPTVPIDGPNNTTITYNTVPCTPFQAVYINKAEEVARAVINTSAFESCVSERMQANYVRARDPDLCDSPPCTRSELIDTAWDSLWTAPHVQIVCTDGPINGADDDVNNSGNSNTRILNIGLQQREDFAHWDPMDPNFYDEDQEPWNFRAQTTIHELMHTSGFSHCSSGCPSGYDATVNSAPYIYGSCAHDVVYWSGISCDGPISSACPPGEFYLRANWYAGDCSCVPISGDTWALSNLGGWYVSAVNGGGGDARANAQYRGSWENLHVVDHERSGRVSDGDLISFRAHHTNNWFRVTGTDVRADGNQAQAAWFEVYGVSSGPVDIGDQVFLKDSISGMWLRTAANGSSDLVVGSNYQLANGMFKVERPWRSEMVYLRSFHNKYVTRSGNDLVNSSSTPSRLSAFWVLDHNGGNIESGDQISFEAFELNKWIRSTAGGSTRADVLGDAIRDWTRYVITKVSGSTGTQIRHGDTVSLRSVSLNLYLTAMPADYFPNQVLTYGTTADTWQRFVWNRVSQFDRARPQFDP